MQNHDEMTLPPQTGPDAPPELTRPELAGPELTRAERDPRGRFATGNAGGPGNPYIRRINAFRRAVLEAVTESDLKAILAAVVRRALDGDMQAARVLLELERPEPRIVDPRRPE